MLPIPVEAGSPVELVLPFLPKSKNDYERMPFLHRRGYRSKWYRHLTMKLPTLGLGRVYAVEVEIVLTFGSKRARDWQNYAWPLIHDIADSLVRVGIIPSDTPEHFRVGPNAGIVFEVDANRLLPTGQRQKTLLRITPIEA